MVKENKGSNRLTQVHLENGHLELAQCVCLGDVVCNTFQYVTLYAFIAQ